MIQTYGNVGKELGGDAGANLKALDRILELLQDSQAHSLGEIEVQIPLPAERLAFILDFLAECELIELNAERSKVTITAIGVSFLELPLETRSEKHF